MVSSKNTHSNTQGQTGTQTDRTITVLIQKMEQTKKNRTEQNRTEDTHRHTTFASSSLEHLRVNTSKPTKSNCPQDPLSSCWTICAGAGRGRCEETTKKKKGGGKGVQCEYVSEGVYVCVCACTHVCLRWQPAQSFGAG